MWKTLSCVKIMDVPRYVLYLRTWTNRFGWSCDYSYPCHLSALFQRCMVLATLPKLEVIYRCNISLSLMLCHGQPSEVSVCKLPAKPTSYPLVHTPGLYLRLG